MEAEKILKYQVGKKSPKRKRDYFFSAQTLTLGVLKEELNYE